MGSFVRDSDTVSMRSTIKILLVVAIVGVTAKRAASTAMRGSAGNVLSPLEMETVAALVKISAKASSALKGGEHVSHSPREQGGSRWRVSRSSIPS